MYRYKICPVCHSSKFKCDEYAEECYGIVERHNRCPRCGYIEEQAYSECICGFFPPVKRGHKGHKKYIKKNIRSFKRIKRKYGIKIDRYLDFI
jgi:hypothetical protein